MPSYPQMVPEDFWNFSEAPKPWWRVAPTKQGPVFPDYPGGLPVLPWSPTIIKPQTQITSEPFSPQQAQGPKYTQGQLHPQGSGPYEGLTQGQLSENPWANSPPVLPPEMPPDQAPPGMGGGGPAIAQGMTQQQPNDRQPFEQLNQVPQNPLLQAAQMPQGQQQPGQQGGSNAMLMGILSAGLGILANNTGHYGAAGPAIGRGGQIGLGTYLQQSQQEIENTRRDALAKAAEVKWQQQAESLKEVARHNRSMEDKSKYMVVGPGQMLTADGKEVFTNTNEKPGGTQYERALEILRSAELKHRRGEQLTPEEQLHAQDSAALLSRQQMYQDTRTGQWFIQPPMDISHYQSVAKVPPGGAHLASVPGLAVPNAPGAGRIALDAGTEKEMQGLGDARAQLNNLIPQFKDEYGGFSLDAAGQLAIEAGRRLPEGTLGANPDLANWWQSYYSWSNDVRAAKFGLTLTGNELTAFERATPKPGDDPKIIRRALAKQLAILEEKGKRRIDSIKAGGGNVPQAEALYGRGNAATSQDMTGTPTRIRTPAEMFKGK